MREGLAQMKSKHIFSVPIERLTLSFLLSKFHYIILKRDRNRKMCLKIKITNESSTIVSNIKVGYQQRNQY